MQQPTLLQQFRSFCYQNNATNLEQAIEYFSVFGGMGWNVDFEVPLSELIEEKVLDNYRYIHGDITKVTQSEQINHKILTALALGDRREHSAFKKAQVNREHGEDAIDFLVEKGFLTVEKSVEKPLKGHEGASNKLLFNQPFIRFWFAVISPHYKSIKAEEYDEFEKRWADIRAEFSNHIYQQLVMALVEKNYNETHEDPIVTIGSYWDTKLEIDLLAKTKAGKYIAGACKFSKAKAKKSEITKLQEICTLAKLESDTYVLFSKNKFSTELKKAKADNIQLYSLKSLGNLLFELNEKDLIESTNKMY